MESKIKKINQIHKDIIKYYKEYIDLYDLVHELLKHESELQYLKLLYENKKYNEELEIVMEHNVEELLQYNNIMLKALLYYIWDCKGQIKFEIEPEFGFEIDLEYGLWLKDLKIELSLENYRKLHEIIPFTKLYVIKGWVYIQDREKYEKYIKFWKWDNIGSRLKFKFKEEIITSTWDAADIRINVMGLPKEIRAIHVKWEKILENKIKEYNIEYKKGLGLYLEYFKKL